MDIVSISFEGIGKKSFENEENFCLNFMKLVRESLSLADISDEYKEAWVNKDVDDFMELSYHIKKMCKDQKIVLMIDEVDKTSNNGVFLDFLSMLRAKFLARKAGEDYTFHSVILAGVYDIKNIKLKMINEGSLSPRDKENKLYNSPWNIAADFDVDMSFNPQEIETMLKDYKSENDVTLESSLISQEIYNYTNGYPYLVSKICKIIDEKLNRNWSKQGVLEAVKIIIVEKDTLSDDLIKNLHTYKGLYDLLYSILIDGESIEFDEHNSTIDLGNMFGYIKRENESGKTIISNKIFETLMTNFFISEDSISLIFKDKFRSTSSSDFIKNNSFDMELCLCKFSDHYRLS